MQKRLSPRARLTLWMITACTIFLALLLLVLGIVSLFMVQSKGGKTVTFTCGTGSRRDPSYEQERGIYMPQGTAYADFTQLSVGCFYATSGTENEIRYVIKTSEGVYHTVTFFYDSRKAVVNGTHITLTAPVRRYGQSVLVPCEFITFYMEGVTATVTEESIRVIYEEGRVSLKPSLAPLDKPGVVEH